MTAAGLKEMSRQIIFRVQFVKIKLMQLVGKKTRTEAGIALNQADEH